MEEDCTMDAMERISMLFAGWNDTLVKSCLQGCMGEAVAATDFSAARITVGDFCFFAGQPSVDLVREAPAPILVPHDDAWAAAIESVWQDQVKKDLRYAIRQEPADIFDCEKLAGYAADLPAGYYLKLFDRACYHQSMAQVWSQDFCALFAGPEDYLARGIGVGAYKDDLLVAGASSYAVYEGGIEIEIDTEPEFQGKGLASACGAQLILACLARNLTPTWDACDLRSVHLAEKLGYHMKGPYMVYFLR